MHDGNGSGLDLAALFAQSQGLARREDLILPPAYRHASIDITNPATARGQATVAKYLQIAAADMKLPERFEGVKARFAESTQGIFIMPVVSYNEKDPECYKVVWSPDGKSFTIDLSQALVWRKWETPAGFIRRAPVYLQRNMPNNTGSVLYIDLKNSQVRSRNPKKRTQATSAEAAAAKQ